MKILLHGDCLEQIKIFKENSIDSIVTDPPYGISFMGKKWDYDVPSVDVWKECLRVLKPGGHLLSFSGSRTYHRMAVRIEDAGFEIRDQIMWIYGSGFPKSHNIGKAVDKLQGNDREDLGPNPNGRPNCEDEQPTTMGGKYKWSNVTKGQSEWEGWGTALKPAHEPIVMARKPFKGSVAENVLEWGTGGINIDDSRISTEDVLGRQVSENDLGAGQYGLNDGRKTKPTNKLVGTFNDNTKGLGRWPANIILDEEAGQVLDEQSGISSSKPYSVKAGFNTSQVYGKAKDIIGTSNHNDKGGASRFFYCPKASKKDRDAGLDEFNEKHNKTWNERLYTYPDGSERPEYKLKNNHPTVKPTELMLYLIKLVTPKGGTVMDCFMGSGSTGKAAIRGGYEFIGIEREEEYMKISEARINNELNG